MVAFTVSLGLGAITADGSFFATLDTSFPTCYLASILDNMRAAWIGLLRHPVFVRFRAFRAAVLSTAADSETVLSLALGSSLLPLDLCFSWCPASCWALREGPLASGMLFAVQPRNPIKCTVLGLSRIAR